MPIAIVLRTSGTKNTFRDVLIDSLDSGHVDEALLCSGFFQENFRGSPYQVSAERSLAQVCVRRKISLTTVGIHNPTWTPAYRNFQTNMVAAGVRLQCLYKPGTRWHAKVFIASTKGVPQMGIIGSSNMTRNAFSTGKAFNNECDVFVWDRRSPIAPLATEYADRLGEDIIIRAPYLRRMNEGQTVPELLDRIRAEVLSADLQEL